MTTDLAEFLRARYGEARRAEEGKTQVKRDAPPYEIRYERGGEYAILDGHRIDAAEFWSAYGEPCPDPGVLADLDAKLALLNDLLAEKHYVNDGDCWYTCPAATEERDGGENCDDNRHGWPCDCGRDARVERHLRILAQPFTDHPEYPQEGV